MGTRQEELEASCDLILELADLNAGDPRMSNHTNTCNQAMSLLIEIDTYD